MLLAEGVLLWGPGEGPQSPRLHPDTGLGLKGKNSWSRNCAASWGHGTKVVKGLQHSKSPPDVARGGEQWGQWAQLVAVGMAEWHWGRMCSGRSRVLG